MATACILEHSGNSPHPVENLHEEAAGQEQQMWVLMCLLNAGVTDTLMANYLKMNVHFGIENASSFLLQREGNMFSLDFCSICIFMSVKARAPPLDPPDLQQHVLLQRHASISL